MASRALVLALVLLVATVTLAPTADAADCVSPPPVCHAGSVPWPRTSGGGCGSQGVQWTCAWLW